MVHLVCEDHYLALGGHVFVKDVAAFAAFARAQRMTAGLTQAVMAERIGMGRRWVQEFESGNLIPSLAAALKVASPFRLEMHLEDGLVHPEIDALFESLT